MEKIVEHIKLVGLKQESIRKLFDGDSSSVLSLTHPWKELEDQLELAKISLLNYGKELDLLAKRIAEDSKVLERRDREVELKLKEVKAKLNDLQSGDKQISLIVNWIMDLSFELTSKEQLLYSAQKEVEGCNEMLLMKREELEFVQKEHEQYSKEISIKEKQLGEIEKSIQEQNQELKSNEEKLSSVRTKLEECCNDFSVKQQLLESVQESIQLHCKQLEVKQKELENAKNSAASFKFEIELKETELTMKTNQLNTVERKIEECLEKLKSEEMKLLTVKENLNKCCDDFSVKSKQLETLHKELELKEKEVEKVKTSEDLELKQSELALVKSLISDCRSELELKQKQYEALQGLISVSSDELDLKAKKMSTIDKSVQQCENELKLKKKELNGAEKMMQECLNELDLKQKQLAEVKKKIERSSNIVSSKEKHLDSLAEQLVSVEEKLRCAKSKEEDMKEHQIDQVYWNRQALEPFEQNFHLQAHKLDNSLSVYDEKTSQLALRDDTGDHDLAKFVLSLMEESYSPRCKSAGESATKIVLVEKLIEFSPLISAVVKTEAAKLAVYWKANLSLETDKSMEVWAFVLFLTAYRLVPHFKEDEILKLGLVIADQRNAPDICRLLGFTNKIPEIIEALIERKQHIDAARFSSAFGLQHKFPVEFILQNCFEHIKGKAIDEELSVLKAMLHSVSDNKLELGYNTQAAYDRIIELENQKGVCSKAARTIRVGLLEICSSKDQQKLHNQNYRDALVLHNVEGSSKCARTSEVHE